MLSQVSIRDKMYRGDLEDFLKAISDGVNVVAVLLFGSLAKGLAKPYPESDVDLLVVAKNLPGNLVDRRLQTLKLKRRPMAIEDIWMTPKELEDAVEGGWGLVLDALAEGITIHDPEGLLKAAREAVNGRYRRVGKIWVLKPV